MREKIDCGRIVFISSESALHIPAEMVHYGMTKTAQVAVARGIAESCAGTGVTANSVLRRSHCVRRREELRRQEVPVQVSWLLHAHELILLEARTMAKQAAEANDDGTNDI